MYNHDNKLALYISVLGIRNWIDGANFVGLSKKIKYSKFEIMVDKKDVELLVNVIYKINGKAHISSRDRRFYIECDRQQRIKFGI